VSLHSSDIMLP